MISGIKKKHASDTPNSVDESWKHCAVGEEPDTGVHTEFMYLRSQNGQSQSVAMESGFMGSECPEVSESRHLGMMGRVHSSVVEIVV